MSAETFDPSGKINAAATARGMKLNESFGQSLRSIGEQHAFLDAAEMREITGTDYYLGGLYTPGAVLSSRPTTSVVSRRSGFQGRHLRELAVTALKRRNGNWTALTTRHRHRPEGDRRRQRPYRGFRPLRRRLMHIFTYASMTAPFPRTMSAGGRARPLGTASGRSDGRDGAQDHLRRPVAHRDPHEVHLRDDDSCFRVAHGEDGRGASPLLDARFPDLAALPFEYSWAGRLCLSLNHVPAFGEVEEGLYSACCENGLGTVKSTLAGMMAADLATGSIRRSSNNSWINAEPSKLPPEPFAWLGINSVIRLQELRAGREG